MHVEHREFKYITFQLTDMEEEKLDALLQRIPLKPLKDFLKVMKAVRKKYQNQKSRVNH